MRILVTGAKGFVGRNLCSQLNNIREGKAHCYGNVQIDAVYEYDITSTPRQLDEWCRDCDFVFNLAGVNRPQDPKEFMEGNFGFATTLLNTLKKYKNNCPVMISSSIQATLSGRFGTSEYGKSKKAGEELMFEYGKETGAKVLVYRFPNLFGKWCRPNYNSAIATFCHNIAHDLPIQVNDRSVEMELLYIDDLVDEMIAALSGNEHRCEFEGPETVSTDNGRYCFVPVTHKTTLGEIVDIINGCAGAASNKDGINMAELPQGSLRYKLMTTYLSYLPKEKA
ncbi:MAG: NAD-dependent epimerase/dehydratase family protein, partial [Bacteroidaceae bacterium]|nr:NAD-dependent epimerase/dehydratase family protein [Bacteroidaceae bacterium]